MENNKLYNMSFAKVYSLLLAKAIKKYRAKEEVFEVTSWLTGYHEDELDTLLESDITYGDFFLNAPMMNPKRFEIKGAICGVRIENIEDPLMRDIRCLDKLVDDLAKGKAIDKILK